MQVPKTLASVQLVRVSTVDFRAIALIDRSQLASLTPAANLQVKSRATYPARGHFAVCLYHPVTPLSGGMWTDDFQAPSSNGRHQLYMNEAAPDYLQTMRIPILQGRDFRWDDTMAGGRKIILNRSAAKLLFPDRSPIGQQVTLVDGKKLYEVIGVVGDIRYRSIRNDDPPGGYAAITQNEEKKVSYTMVVRLDGPVAPFAAAVRRLTAQMAPDIPAPIFTTMSGEH